MKSGKKQATFCFDSMVNSPKMQLFKIFTIEIVVEHFPQKFSKILNIDDEKFTQLLNLEYKIAVDQYSLNECALVTVFVHNIRVLKEEVEITTNVVGALRTSGDASISLVFRVINESSNDFFIHKFPRFRLNDFREIEFLSRGSHGKTSKVIDSENRFHVLKRMHRKINIKDKDDVTIREIIPLISLPKHPCLIRLDGFISDSPNEIILVLEHTSQGRIDSIDFENLSKDKRVRILYGLFSFFAFFHDHSFVHRDICPSNVLVIESYEVKIIDYGSSRILDKDMTNRVGHNGYMLPEYSKNYDEFVDLYSLGVLLSELSDSYFLRVLSSYQTGDKICLTCSEICTLIESGMFIAYSNETE